MKIYPEFSHKILRFKRLSEENLKKEFLLVGSEVVNALKNMIPSLSDPDMLNYMCQQLSKKLKNYQFTAYDFYLMKEALIMTIERINHTVHGFVESSIETKWAITKVFKLVRNLMCEKDMDEIDDQK